MSFKLPVSVSVLLTYFAGGAAIATVVALIIVGATMTPARAILARATGETTATQPFGPCQDEACTCLDNMHQVGYALLGYYQDYDEKFPSGIGQPGVGWAKQVESYTHTARPFQCPSDTTVATRPRFVVSYGFNVNNAARSEAGITAPSATVLLFELSGDTVLLHQPQTNNSATSEGMISAAADGTDGTLKDYGDTSSLLYQTGYLGARPPAASNSQFAGPYGRHDQGSNFALDDGHVSFFAPSQVSSGTNAASPVAGQTGTTTGAAAGTNNMSYDATFSTN